MAEKTIVEKLKLEKYQNPIVVNSINDSLVKDLKARTDQLEPTELMIIFVKNIDEMKDYFEKAKDLIKDDGLLAFAYAKKGNKLYDSYVHRDEIFPTLEVDDDGYPKGSLLKFNRMVKYDDNFTLVALKKTAKHEVYEKDGRVDDYKKFIPDLMKQLDDNTRKLFDELTPGYQRDWARYVYSAKTEATQQKHLGEMKDILKQGYKTINLYRQGKK